MNNIKRAAIYDPYLDTLGGGERYVLTIAQALIENGWTVDIQWSGQNILKQNEQRLGLDLSKINVVENVNRGKGYDLIFWLSDGSIPWLFAKQNLIHFQTPFQNVNGKSLLNRLKLLKIDKVICNSNFTKKFIDSEFGVKSYVLLPPVSVDKFKSTKKENIILSVGRFSQLQQSKRQDVLIDAFKKMCDKGLKGWKLVLIGGSDVGRDSFVDNLKSSSKGYQVEILENLPFEEMVKYYAKSKIFWSASGFDINEEKEPFKVEHFGITVVEAMSAGAVPIVVNKGGHKEIIDNETDGILWENVTDLIIKTSEIIDNSERRDTIAKKAEEKSAKFSSREFQKNFIKLLK